MVFSSKQEVLEAAAERFAAEPLAGSGTLRRLTSALEERFVRAINAPVGAAPENFDRDGTP